MEGSSRDRWGGSPAILVVDVSRKRADPDLETAYPAVVDAAERTGELLDVARSEDVPVLFTRGGKSYYTSGGAELPDLERGGWLTQNRIRDESAADARRAFEIAPAVAPQADEVVVTKRGPSGFFQSPLASYLAQLGTDTVVITGIMTSCCVRATVTDAFSHGYPVVVPDECVADRRPRAHDYHLTEMDQKFADVVDVAEVTEYLRERSS